MGNLGVGVCVAHTHPISAVGMIMTGAATNNSEYMPDARSSDILLSFCGGHVGILVTGSPTSLDEGPSTSRVLDIFAGVFSGVLTDGAGTHVCGN